MIQDSFIDMENMFKLFDEEEEVSDQHLGFFVCLFFLQCYYSNVVFFSCVGER